MVRQAGGTCPWQDPMRGDFPTVGSPNPRPHCDPEKNTQIPTDEFQSIIQANSMERGRSVYPTPPRAARRVMSERRPGPEEPAGEVGSGDWDRKVTLGENKQT